MQKRFLNCLQPFVRPDLTYLRVSPHLNRSARVSLLFVHNKLMSSTAEAQPTKKQKMTKVCHTLVLGIETLTGFGSGYRNSQWDFSL